MEVKRSRSSFSEAAFAAWCWWYAAPGDLAAIAGLEDDDEDARRGCVSVMASRSSTDTLLMARRPERRGK